MDAKRLTATNAKGALLLQRLVGVIAFLFGALSLLAALKGVYRHFTHRAALPRPEILTALLAIGAGMAYLGGRLVAGRRGPRDHLLGPVALYLGASIFGAGAILAVAQSRIALLEFGFYASAVAACVTLARRRARGLPDQPAAGEAIEPE